MNNSLLKNKVFRVVMATDFIQQTSIWIRNIAVLYFVMEVTNNNSIAVSMLTVLEYLPMFMFSFIGGTMADRWDPKKTMIFGDLISYINIYVGWIMGSCFCLYILISYSNAIFCSVIIRYV